MNTAVNMCSQLSNRNDGCQNVYTANAHSSVQLLEIFKISNCDYGCQYVFTVVNICIVNKMCSQLLNRNYDCQNLYTAVNTHSC